MSAPGSVWPADPRPVLRLAVAFHVVMVGVGAFAVVPEYGFNARDMLKLIVGAPAIIGGCLGAYAAHRGIWYVERAALKLEVVSVCARLAILATMTTTAPLETCSRALILGLVFIQIAIRYVRISGAALDPTRTAKPSTPR